MPRLSLSLCWQTQRKQSDSMIAQATEQANTMVEQATQQANSMVAQADAQTNETGQ